MELLALSAIITILLIAYKKEILSGVKKLSVEIKKIKKAKKPTEKPTEKAIKEYIIKIVNYNYSFVKLQTVPASKKMIYGISVAIMTKSEKSSTHREK